MVFSSSIFIFIFLPIVCITYYIIPHKFRNSFLLLSSLIFLAWGSVISLYVMLLSILCNYLVGLGIDKYKDNANTKKLILSFGVILNLGILMYYKYSNAIVYKIIDLTNWNISWNEVVLPIGISFFIFQGMSYILDLYRDDAKLQKNPLDLALYISLFPQLIAGPIVRYSTIEDQLKHRSENLNLFVEGLQIFIIGLAKKMLLANTMGKLANNIMDNIEMQSSLVAWLGIISYAMQIYYDFSAYSEMAMGLGKMFGFEFPKNFDFPYLSKSLSEFWRRWHMTLSTWFRDYLYIPLGGNRRGNEYVNLLIVFACTGIWHGAAGKYLLWGLWHGLFLMIEHAIRKKNKDKAKAPNRFPLLGWLYTSFVVLMGWVLFRAIDLGHALNYYSTMFGINNGSFVRFSIFYYLDNYYMFLFILSILMALKIPQNLFSLILNKFSSFRDVFNAYIKPVLLLVCFSLCIIYLINGTFNPFIYFRF